MKLLVISGHDVLGEILRRNAHRESAPSIARRLGIGMPSVEAVANDWNKRTHSARLGDRETVESNLPIPQSAFRIPHSK